MPAHPVIDPEEDVSSNIARYRRITAKELSTRLNRLGLTAKQFSRLHGSQRKRVIKWATPKPGADSEEPIPHSVAVLTTLLIEVPEAMAIARRVTEELMLEEEDDDGGNQHPRSAEHYRKG